jgi:V8-like Glu-specific endopeptidase
MGPGNSGSVVLNTNYEVVGIYTGRTGIYSEVPRYQKIRNTDYD